MSCTDVRCAKSVRIRSCYGQHFPRIFPYLVRMRENVGKMRTRITPNTDTYYAVVFVTAGGLTKISPIRFPRV